MILLVFLSLLLAAASGEQFGVRTHPEKFQCGSDTKKWTKDVAAFTVEHCQPVVIEAMDLCCKEHDLCFEAHALRGYTQGYCDQRFCNCMLDIKGRTNVFQCGNAQHTFCAMTKTFGAGPFEKANPENYESKFTGFVDQKPLGLDMKTLFDACHFSKRLAVHCHDSVQYCLKGDHERAKRLGEEESYVRESYQDCRSTMYDCLQTIIDSNATITCTAIARSYSEQVNVYTDLDERKHGKAIIDTYPIVAARLLKQCSGSTDALVSCYRDFNHCAENNRVENPHLFNAARRINIECHKDLSKCIGPATRGDTTEDCVEARVLATSLIRDLPLEKEKSLLAAGIMSLKDIADAELEEFGDAALKKAKEVGSALSDGVDKGVEWGKGAWDSTKGALKSGKDFVMEGLAKLNPFG